MSAEFLLTSNQHQRQAKHRQCDQSVQQSPRPHRFKPGLKPTGSET